MDAHRFDDLTKTLATAHSRRRVVRALVGGAAGGFLVLLGRGAAGAKPADKVGVCHLTGDSAHPVVYLEVAASSVAEHLAHGDAVGPDFQDDSANCGGCGLACASGEICAGGVCLANSCPVCPGGHGCDGDGGCICSAAGVCDGEDPTPCGLLHGSISMGCEGGCCCIPSGLGGGVYPCEDLNAPHPYCCSGWCDANGGCGCIPDYTTGLYPCTPGADPHCCSGYCGAAGLCEPAA